MAVTKGDGKESIKKYFTDEQKSNGFWGWQDGSIVKPPYSWLKNQVAFWGWKEILQQIDLFTDWALYRWAKDDAIY